MTESQPKSTSLALSGGGHRASLFTLGALLYLVDSGRNTDVTSIASVSGGSLTNGVIAQADTSFVDMDRKTFLTATGPLIRGCAFRGTVVVAPAVALWGAVLVTAIAALVLLFVSGLPSWTPDLLGTWTAPVVAGILAVVILGLIACRTRLADVVFRRQLFKNADGETVTLSKIQAPGKRGSGPVTHVFCSSELQSSLHTYFSGDFAYNHRFGLTQTAASRGLADLPLSTVVQASACFPPAFPPRRLKASKLGFPLHSDDKLWLSDGGVYDNMGDQWATGFVKRADRLGAIAPVIGEQPQRLIVVNSSFDGPWKSASLLQKTPLLGELFIFGSIVKLMHRVGTTNRRSRLIDEFKTRRAASYPDDVGNLIGAGGTLVHIGTPADWPLQSSSIPEPGTRQREIYDALKASTAITGDWASKSHRLARDLATGLWRIGEKKAAALIWQGYTQCMVNMRLFVDADTTEPDAGSTPTSPGNAYLTHVPTEDEIRKIVKDSAERAGPAIAEGMAGPDQTGRHG